MKALASIRASILRAIHHEGQTMYFRQTHVWSRAIMWTIIGTAIALFVWACLAHVDQVVHAPGKLEPQGSVQDVQSPVAGVISAILVEEGARVTTGQPLIRLDPSVASAELKSLNEMLASMKNEESFYNQLFQAGNVASPPAKLPQEIGDLAKNLVSLHAENRLLRSQIAFSDKGVSLDPDQKKLFDVAEMDRMERLHQANLKAERAEKDLSSAASQLEQGRRLLENSHKILASYKKLVGSGGVSRVDYLAREAEAIQAETQVKRLEGLSLSLSLEISRAREEATNINTAYRKESMLLLSANMKNIAEIESGLTKTRLMNSQKISEIESRLAQSSSALEHHEITSPSDGIVFEIVASKPGAVVAPKDTVLKIVPTEELIAKVDITNRDIGFVREGLTCQVEIESFPAREYGRIDGRLIFVGSDALPPTQAKPFYSFPAKISLARQSLDVRGHSVPLQSGMAVSVNIKIRNRRVINIFVDSLLGPIDKMQEVR